MGAEKEQELETTPAPEKPAAAPKAAIKVVEFRDGRGRFGKGGAKKATSATSGKSDELTGGEQLAIGAAVALALAGIGAAIWWFATKDNNEPGADFDDAGEEQVA